MTEIKTTAIPRRQRCIDKEHPYIGGAKDIYDDANEKNQETINSELIQAVGTGGSVDSRIAAAVNVEKTRAEGAESTLTTNLGNEVTRATNAEEALDGRVDTLEDAVGTGGSVDSRISAAVATETTRAQGAESNLSSGKADKATTLAGYGITDAYTKSETYTKTEVNGLVDTPHQEYVTVDAYANLPATGSKDTIYRVSNYNGSTSQVDASVYSEYAWDGTQYVFLCVKSQIGEIFDISVYNNNAKYADLAAALNGGANIPQSLQKGGMSIKFVCSSDNKYMQYRLMNQSWSTTVSDWQECNVEPTFGYDSFTKDEYINNNGVVESGGGSWSSTDYIPIIKGEKYVACLRGYKDSTSWVAFYDINKNLVSFVACTSSSYETISGTITDDSIAYCRFSTKNEQNASLYWKIITDTNTIKSDFLSLINGNKNERLITPLFSEDGVVEDGGVWNPTYVWKSTQYIPVFEGMTYEVKGVGTATVTLIAFYDGNKNYVSCITYSQSNVVTLYADKIPSGIRYIRCCTKTAYISNSYVKVENTSNLANSTYGFADNIKTLEYGQKWVNIIEEVINTTSINKIYPIAPIKGKVQFNVRIDVADTSDIEDWYMPTVYVDYADGTEELVKTVQVLHPFAFYAEKEVVAIRLEKNNTLNWQGTYYLDMFSMDVQNEFDDAKAEPLTYDISGKNIVLFGDSITQGEVATDADNNSYAGILRKMFVLEHGGNMNYGFCHFANNRENPGYMVSLVSHVGWTENYSNNSVLGGDSYTTSTSDAELIFKIDKPCNYIKVACKYGTTLGSFKVMQGETILDTIDLSIDDSGAGVSSAIDVSNVDFSQNFTIKCISGEVVVSGIVCIDNLNWWTYNNYGRSGSNPLLFIGSLFEKQASDASVVFYALGANGTKENLESTIASIKDTFKNLNAIKIVLDVNNYSLNRLGKPDSSSPNGTYEKKSLLKYLAEYVGATYICVADHYPKTAIGNVISGFFAEDNLHPTDKGHQFIAELIAKNIGLNVNSKFLAEKLLSNNI